MITYEDLKNELPTGTLPSFYYGGTHIVVCALLKDEQKLSAIKYLKDMAKLNNDLIGLKEAKEIVDYIHNKHKMEIIIERLHDNPDLISTVFHHLDQIKHN